MQNRSRGHSCLMGNTSLHCLYSVLNAPNQSGPLTLLVNWSIASGIGTWCYMYLPAPVIETSS
jgi:hypothetical protein